MNDLLVLDAPQPKPTPVVRPRLLRVVNKADRDEIEQLLGDATVEVHETIQQQLRELVQMRHPGRRLTAGERAGAILELLGGRTLTEYGTWVYYPWSRRLVHVLEAADLVELRTSRNRSVITADEQERVAARRIGIVGLSAGQSVALALALERRCGELRLADDGRLTVSDGENVHAGLHEIGLSNVAIAARGIAELDPYLPVTCFFDGLREEHAGSFFTEGGVLDLVIDGGAELDAKVLLWEWARDLHVPRHVQARAPAGRPFVDLRGMVSDTRRGR